MSFNYWLHYQLFSNLELSVNYQEKGLAIIQLKKNPLKPERYFFASVSENTFLF